MQKLCDDLILKFYITQSCKDFGDVNIVVTDAGEHIEYSRMSAGNDCVFDGDDCHLVHECTSYKEIIVNPYNFPDIDCGGMY